MSSLAIFCKALPRSSAGVKLPFLIGAFLAAAPAAFPADAVTVAAAATAGSSAGISS